MAQWSSFLSPSAYGIMHRLHYAYADSEDNPHSPSYSKGIFEMMWKTWQIHNGFLLNQDSVEAKFKKGVPDL